MKDILFVLLCRLKGKYRNYVILVTYICILRVKVVKIYKL